MLEQTIEAEARALERKKAATINLHEAVVTDDLEGLQAALAGGADPDVTDASGATPLLVAVTFDRAAAAGLLLEAGADMDAANRDGSTPLHMAALLARADIAALLLENGADKTLRTGSGATALEIAQAPFEALKPVYDYLDQALAPFGLVLDRDRIRRDRPGVAAMLAAD